LIIADVAGPKGIPQLAPPWDVVSPVTLKDRTAPAEMVPPARRVSMIRQGVTGV